MNELTIANRAANWQRLKTLVLDNVSAPITKGGVFTIWGLMSFSPGSAWNPGPSAVCEAGRLYLSNVVITGRELPASSKNPLEPSGPITAGSHQNTPLPRPSGVFLHNPI